MVTAEGEFRSACQRHGVKRVNKTVCAALGAQPLDALHTVDLQTTYVGNRGLLALLDVVEQAPSFRSLDLSGQRIYNTDLSPDSVKGNALLDRLIELARGHPALTAINLSGNPLSNFAARKLLALANDNSRIAAVQLDDTRVDNDLLSLISKQTQANQQKSGDAFSGAFPPEPGAVSPGTPADGGFGCGAILQPPTNPVTGGTRRRTVMNASYDQNEAAKFVAPKHAKSAADEKMIMGLLRNNLLFSHLESSSLQVCVAAMQRQSYQRGDEPLREGDEGNTLFVIVPPGKVDILKKGEVVAVKPEAGAASSAFGELELMYDTPCVATVRVSTDSLDTWCLDRETYKHLVIGASIRKRRQYESLLSSVPFLQECSAYEKSQIADALSSDEWDAGAAIIRFGDEGEWMFLIVEGTVEIIGRDDAGSPKKVCEMNPGEYFGELEFLNNHACVADVKAVTEVKTAKINRKHIEMCLGPVLHILKRNTGAPKYEHYRKLLEAAGGAGSADATQLGRTPQPQSL